MIVHINAESGEARLIIRGVRIDDKRRFVELTIDELGGDRSPRTIVVELGEIRAALGII